MTRFEKTNCIVKTSEMHFIAPYQWVSNASPMLLILPMAKLRILHEFFKLTFLKTIKVTKWLNDKIVKVAIWNQSLNLRML